MTSRKPGRPREGRQKLSHSISVGMTEQDMADLEEYRESQEIKPSQTSVILTAFRQFITRKREETKQGAA